MITLNATLNLLGGMRFKIFLLQTRDLRGIFKLVCCIRHVAQNFYNSKYRNPWKTKDSEPFISNMKPNIFVYHPTQRQIFLILLDLCRRFTPISQAYLHHFSTTTYSVKNLKKEKKSIKIIQMQNKY